MRLTQHTDSQLPKFYSFAAFKIWLAAVTNVFETGHSSYDVAALWSQKNGGVFSRRFAFGFCVRDQRRS
jgi:hypothetical protein